MTPPDSNSNVPKLYRELASWWPLLSAPAEYAEEATTYRELLVRGCETLPRAVLELGSEGGNNASHLKASFELTLVDRSEAMLAVSRNLNPECEHLQGDMRTVRLEREFDAVFVHDAVCYITTLADLKRVFETAFVHCRAGGAALFAPDFVRETFESKTSHGGHDGNGRGLRYLEWTLAPNPTDTTYFAEMVYLLRDGEEEEVRVEHDRHLYGLFPRDRWLEGLRDVGFDPEVVVSQFAEHFLAKKR